MDAPGSSAHAQVIAVRKFDSELICALFAIINTMHSSN
ncbi:hypothetical protein COO91_10841 (plasmid) [Nostoc flagelliforme CCNUN1]|uniref:Uncharacterized protein n=1 Tax=Nostoc flagelliforme CCNUN1 TaxID=2038116 RepID=A0A2K8TAI9_9NOSO|nr:hypothetical protein COO91_10841 [Nostoc flagelliforme CCNUN1]